MPSKRTLSGRNMGMSRDQAKTMDGVEVLGMVERHAEVPRIEGQIAADVDRSLGQVAHHLVAEEVEGDPVGILSCQLAAEQTDIEVLRLAEIEGRYGQMKDISALSHLSVTQPHGRSRSECRPGVPVGWSPVR